MAAPGDACTSSAVPDRTLCCGDSTSGDVGPGGSLRWNLTVPAAGVVSVTFSTCDTMVDTVIAVDGIDYDDDSRDGAELCGWNNERVAIQVAGRPGAIIMVEARFYNSSVGGTVRLAVVCSTVAPTLSPTTHAPTATGATFSPTVAPTEGVPDSCGYAGQGCGPSEYCCRSSGLRTVPGSGTFTSNTTAVDFYGNRLTRMDATTFLGLTALTWLNLASNRLTELQNGTFSGLTALSRLYLSNNHIAAIGPNAFAWGLTALTKLSLGSNTLTVVDPIAFSGLTALTWLKLESNQLTVVERTTFTELTALTTLYLHSNQLTVIEASTFLGLTALTMLHLNSNQLTMIEPTTFLNTALTMLSLQSNRLTELQNGTFAALLNLTKLNLAANRTKAIDDGVFAFAAMHVGLSGTQDGVPAFLYNPNPLQCGMNGSAGSAAWDGAGLLNCTRCTQGYVVETTASQRHVACTQPVFQLDNASSSPAQHTLNVLRSGLNRSVAYIGEELDVYQQAAAGDRVFEPKREKFRGYAPEDHSFAAIRLEVKVGDIAIGCGSVAVGRLHGPGSQESRISQMWQRRPDKPLFFSETLYNRVGAATPNAQPLYGAGATVLYSPAPQLPLVAPAHPQIHSTRRRRSTTRGSQRLHSTRRSLWGSP